jgi:hypothetical protein
MRDGINSWNEFQQVFSGTFNKINHLYRNSPMNLLQDASEGWRSYCSNNIDNKTPVIGNSKHLTLYKSDLWYNVLNSGRWSLGVNKAWIQGGIDRKSIFKIVSPETAEYVWDEGKNRPKVFGVELRQLRKAGYVKISDHLCKFACLQALTETLVEDPALLRTLRAFRIIFY